MNFELHAELGGELDTFAIFLRFVNGESSSINNSRAICLVTGVRSSTSSYC